MYHKLLILGRSGSGKTSSLRNLDMARTGLINTDRKELPFPAELTTAKLPDGRPDLAKSNYVETSRPQSVLATLKAWEKREDLDVIVLDTITHLITAYYITDALGKDYGGYKELGSSFWNIINQVRAMQKDIVVFGHINLTFNDMGEKVIEMRSHGKMIKEFEPESYFTTLLFSEVNKVDGQLKYQFRCHPREVVEKIKSPVKFDGNQVIRALDEYEPNDIAHILNKLKSFQ